MPAGEIQHVACPIILYEDNIGALLPDQELPTIFGFEGDSKTSVQIVGQRPRHRRVAFRPEFHLGRIDENAGTRMAFEGTDDLFLLLVAEN